MSKLELGLQKEREAQAEHIMAILSQLPALSDTIRQMTSGKTYRAVFTPEVQAKLNWGAAKLGQRGAAWKSVTVHDCAGVLGGKGIVSARQELAGAADPTTELTFNADQLTIESQI